jgi:hypothetical protein
MRAVQAVGAASIVTNTTALLTDAFPPEILSLGLGSTSPSCRRRR